MNTRIKELIDIVVTMRKGGRHGDLPKEVKDNLATMAATLVDLEKMAAKKFEETQKLIELTKKINAGIVLEEVLNFTYETFRPLIPYNRIGFALLEENGRVLRSHWAHADYPSEEIKLPKGFSAKMEGSSLQKIIETGQPRILNNLKTYLKEHPQSAATKRIVEEGIHSSLTCPLTARKKPLGFIFFSSKAPNTYKDIHAELFFQIAEQLSLALEKSRLHQKLIDLNDAKNKFLATAAQDMRPPLEGIAAVIDRLADGHFGAVSDGQMKMLTTVKDLCGRMRILVEKLSDVSTVV